MRSKIGASSQSSASSQSKSNSWSCTATRFVTYLITTRSWTRTGIRHQRIFVSRKTRRAPSALRVSKRKLYRTSLSVYNCWTGVLHLVWQPQRKWTRPHRVHTPFSPSQLSKKSLRWPKLRMARLLQQMLNPWQARKTSLLSSTSSTWPVLSASRKQVRRDRRSRRESISIKACLRWVMLLLLSQMRRKQNRARVSFRTVTQSWRASCRIVLVATRALLWSPVLALLSQITRRLLVPLSMLHAQGTSKTSL